MSVTWEQHGQKAEEIPYNFWDDEKGPHWWFCPTEIGTKVLLPENLVLENNEITVTLKGNLNLLYGFKGAITRL